MRIYLPMNGERVNGDGQSMLGGGAVAQTLNQDQGDHGLMVDKARVYRNID